MKMDSQMIDLNEDKHAADLWDKGSTPHCMTLHEITSLAINGFDTCEDFCGSREYVGEHRCRCIRETFDSPTQYELYLTLRNYMQSILDIAVLAEFSNAQPHKEENERSRHNHKKCSRKGRE
ncbi:MAG: hypothetical protein VX331_07140 [Candidatus Thermoplasmatota archaeon]|nr:hypothetical protein [Candidatus Thermoplasmatota archaeon]